MAKVTAKKSARAAVGKPTRFKAPKAPPSAGRVRKNMDVCQDKLTRVKEVLGAQSETEAVDRALDLVLGRERVRKVMEHAAARGGFRDPFGRG